MDNFFDPEYLLTLFIWQLLETDRSPWLDLDDVNELYN